MSFFSINFFARVQNAFLLCILVGCSSIPEYKEPEKTAEYAMLRITHAEPERYYLVLATFDVPSCKANGLIGVIGGDQPIDNKRIGMLNSSPPSKGIIERTVKANEKLTVGARQLWPNSSFVDGLFIMTEIGKAEVRSRFPATCLVPEFTPVSGGQYEVAMKIAPGVCDVEVFRLMESRDGKVEKIPVRDVRFPIQTTLFESECRNEEAKAKR